MATREERNGIKTTKPKEQRKMSGNGQGREDEQEKIRDEKKNGKGLGTRRLAEKINMDVKWVNEKQGVKRKFEIQRNEA